MTYDAWTYEFGTHSAKKTWVVRKTVELTLRKADWSEWQSLATRAKWKSVQLQKYYTMRTAIQAYYLKRVSEEGEAFDKSSACDSELMSKAASGMCDYTEE